MQDEWEELAKHGKGARLFQGEGAVYAKAPKSDNLACLGSKMSFYVTEANGVW